MNDKNEGNKNEGNLIKTSMKVNKVLKEDGPIDPNIQKIFNKLKILGENNKNTTGAEGVRIPIDSLKIPQSPKNQSNADTKPVSPPTAKQVNEPKVIDNNNEDNLSKYLKALEENKISKEEAINILIGIYYNNEYTKQYKIMGKTVTFQIPPASYTDAKFQLLTEMSPIYKQHENEITIELRIASALKEINGKTFDDEPPVETLKEKYKVIHNLNEYHKASILKKFIEFETKISVVTQTEGADDFFEVEKSQNM